MNNNTHAEKEKLQQTITQLTNKPNKTPQEEAELANKKKRTK